MFGVKELKAPVFKGTSIANINDYCQKVHQTDAFLRIAKSVGLLDVSIIMPFKWYDAYLTQAAVIEVSRELGMSLREFSLNVSKYGLEKDLRAVYKFYLRLSGAVNVLKNAAKIASTYTNFSSYKIIENSNGLHIAEVEFPSELKTYFLALLEGSLSGILSICNARLLSFMITEEIKLADGTIKCKIETRYK